METVARRRHNYPKHRRSRIVDSAWRRGLAAVGEYLARHGLHVEVVSDVMDSTGAYIQIHPDIVVQVEWDSIEAEGLDAPATYGASVVKAARVQHLGYTRSPDELIAVVAGLV